MEMQQAPLSTSTVPTTSLDKTERLRRLRMIGRSKAFPYTKDQIIQATWDAHNANLHSRSEAKTAASLRATQGSIAFYETTRILTARHRNRILAWLVKTCALCGAKALYRQGWEGRCTEHRLVIDAYTKRKNQHYDAVAALDLAYHHRREQYFQKKDFDRAYRANRSK